MPSYMTVDEGQLYFNDRLRTRPWDCASAEERRKALAEATSIIDRLSFLGCKTVDSQENQFPRNDDLTVPQDVKNASAEIALSLLDGVDPELEFENLQLRSQGYGAVRATYDKSPPPPHLVAGIPSVAAWRYLKPYLRDPNTIELKRTS